MGGDGGDGLAAAIAVAILCMALVPTLLFGGLGYALLRKWNGPLGAVLGALLGFGAAALAITATFFESTFEPPPTLAIEVPPGFVHEWIVLIEDPSATAEVAWTGFDLPLTAPSGTLTVPRSGLVRVRSLGRLEGGDLAATLSSGVPLTARVVTSQPAGFGSGRMSVLGFARTFPGTEADLTQLDPTALAERLRALEAER